MILSTAALCLALNVYHEARGEPTAGQYAIAHVTMNRANNDKRQVCKVVLQPRQFSWTAEKVLDRRLLDAGKPTEAQAWETAKMVANTVLAGKMPDFTWGATHFHSKTVRPKWKYRMVLTKAIGGHYFYRAV